MAQIPEEIQELIDVSDSFTGVFNTKDESDQYVRYLGESNFKVVVPNHENIPISGKTRKALIIAEGDFYFYENSYGFYIVIGGKPKEVEKRIISTETIVVPVPYENEVEDVVEDLKSEGYMIFSPTPPDTETEPKITGETEEIIFDLHKCPFEPPLPPFPPIPSPVKPIPGEQYLWVVVGVKE
jgi:hypothetical protein